MKCKHYDDDGYGYKMPDEEMLFCSTCHNSLLIKMLAQKQIEMELEE